MDREQYNVCMKPYMSGKGKSKIERQQSFCAGAKICTGKAATQEEAARMCAVPKVPKWAKTAEKEVKAESISCDERTEQLRNHLEAISLKVREGQAEEVKGLAGQVVAISQTCQSDEVFAQAVSAMNEVHELGSRHYLKGEAKDAIRQIDALKEAVN